MMQVFRKKILKMEDDVIACEPENSFPAYYENRAHCNEYGVGKTVYNPVVNEAIQIVPADISRVITVGNHNTNQTNEATCITSSVQKQHKRKNSIARIGNALRELQHTITPRKIGHRKTTDCTFTEQPNTTTDVVKKKSVKRSISLPNIKENNKKNGKGYSIFRKLSRDHETISIKKSTQTIDTNVSSTRVQHFPSNRLESYRNNKTTDGFATISQEEEEEEELKKINQRRKQGRSRSAQLSLSSENRNNNNRTKRERSLSTDCNEHLFSFETLIEKRLNSSKETMLCSTDL